MSEVNSAGYRRPSTSVNLEVSSSETKTPIQCRNIDKSGRVDALTVVLWGEGRPSVGEIIPCGPSREALLLSRKVTDGDADGRMPVYGGLDCRLVAGVMRRPVPLLLVS